MYKDCILCEKKCHVDRTNYKGFCNATDKMYIARAALHYWEEPIISGENGSGAVFFSNCNLKCIFCQNREISTEGIGKEVSTKRLAEIFVELQNKKANNINLVTPTHYIPSIIEGINLSKKIGLKIPIVYNTSSYESIDALNLLNGKIDIYLPDLKYYDDEIALKYSKVKNYFEIATRNIKEMYNQVGNPIIENDILKKGVIVRVLVLPGHIEDSKKIIKYLYEEYKNNIYISIMNQYTPVNKVEYSNLNRTLTNNEYDEVVNYAIDIGVENAFIQEGETMKESFIPEFNFEGI